MIASNLLAPCQQLTNTLASGELAKLDRIHIPGQSKSTLLLAMVESTSVMEISDPRKFQ